MDLSAFPIDQLAKQLKLSSDQVSSAIALLEQGHSVPFVAQYRLDLTKGLGEGALSRLNEMLSDHRHMASRRRSLTDYLRNREALTESLETEIQTADSRDQLEQLFSIHKRHRQPKALADRQEVLNETLAAILDGTLAATELNNKATEVAAASELFESADDVLSAVRELLIHHYAQSLPVRALTLKLMRETGKFRSSRYVGEATEESDSEELGTGESDAGEPETGDTPTASDAPNSPESAVMPGSSGMAETAAADDASQVSDSTDAADAASDSEASDKPLPAEGSAGPGPEAETSVPADRTPKIAKPMTAADQRRKRRKETRLRRRAHLESALRPYFGWECAISELSNSQYADIEYGERVRVLTLSVDFDDERLKSEGAKIAIPEGNPNAEYLTNIWLESLQRTIIPDCERALRRGFAIETERQAMVALRRQVREHCMQRPLYQTVISIVGHRDGFAVAVLDATGSSLHTQDLTRNDFGPEKIKTRLLELAREHAAGVLAIADSARTKLIERLVTESLGAELAELGVGWFSVVADGVESYSKSALGCEEIPGLPPEQRIAVAVGRRAQNPLFELVKCSARDWLTEKQQAVIDANGLQRTLASVYQSCLFRVGVDLNRASPAVLRVALGIDESTARKIEAYRHANGPFTSFKQLSEAAELSEVAVAEAAGVLRIYDGENALDGLGIHPDHYSVATSILEKCGGSLESVAQQLLRHRPPVAAKKAATGAEGQTEDSAKEGISGSAPAEAPKEPPATLDADWIAGLRKLSYDDLARELSVTQDQLKRIINELRFCGRDIRLNSKLPVVRQGKIDIHALQAGEMFAGRVVNVANFGAFVEISQGITGLVHISRLGDRFVRDPRELLAVGEVLPVYVVSVDQEKQRIALSLTSGGQSSPAKRSTSKPPRKRQQQDKNRFPRKPKKFTAKARKPRPVVPITDEMKDGKEPMRTFGDLKQFFEHRDKDADDDKK